jgi:hypothetical protein
MALNKERIDALYKTKKYSGPGNERTKRNRELLESGLQECSICGKTLPVSEFHKNKLLKSGIEARCKDCSRNKRNDFYHSIEKGGTHLRDRMYKARYGISHDDYESLYETQDGKCALCLKSVDKYELCVDHCHNTGQVRGLLCRGCNAKLGWFENHRYRVYEYLK